MIDTCTSWTERNKLKWKPAKCTVVMENVEGPTAPLVLAGEELSTTKEAKYLGIIAKPTGFTKKTDRETETKCRVACSVITAQPFFCPSLPINTIRTLYRTNVRGILLYGAALTTSTDELVRIDRKLLQQYFKAILFSKKDIPQKLIYRLCVKVRMPSMEMEIEKKARNWTLNLTKKAQWFHVKKVKLHPQEYLQAIRKLLVGRAAAQVRNKKNDLT